MQQRHQKQASQQKGGATGGEETKAGSTSDEAKAESSP